MVGLLVTHSRRAPGSLAYLDFLVLLDESAARAPERRATVFSAAARHVVHLANLASLDHGKDPTAAGEVSDTAHERAVAIAHFGWGWVGVIGILHARRGPAKDCGEMALLATGRVEEEDRDEVEERETYACMAGRCLASKNRKGCSQTDCLGIQASAGIRGPGCTDAGVLGTPW